MSARVDGGNQCIDGGNDGPIHRNTRGNGRNNRIQRGVESESNWFDCWIIGDGGGVVR